MSHVTKSRPVMVRMRPEQYQAVQELSDRDDRSLASWIRLAVDDRLATERHREAAMAR